jgi:glutaredoxin
MIQLPPFVLYGLFGCPHCVEAEKVLREAKVPAQLTISNDDPIISAGIMTLTGKDEYPVLLYRPTKEVISGFKPLEYDRIIKSFNSLVSASTVSVFDSGQQHSEQNKAAH